MRQRNIGFLLNEMDSGAPHSPCIVNEQDQ
jgi:hypothetical protein